MTEAANRGSHTKKSASRFRIANRTASGEDDGQVNFSFEMPFFETLKDPAFLGLSDFSLLATRPISEQFTECVAERFRAVAMPVMDPLTTFAENQFLPIAEKLASIDWGVADVASRFAHRASAASMQLFERRPVRPTALGLGLNPFVPAPAHSPFLPPPVRGGGVEHRRAPGPVLRQVGESWHVSFAGEDICVKDSAGMGYLELLLSKPAQPVPVLELLAAVNSDPSKTVDPILAEDLPRADQASEGPIVDRQAQGQYQARLNEIRIELQTAHEIGDRSQVETLEKAREFIMKDLKQSFRNQRRPVNRTIERARLSVRIAIRRAISKIGKSHPALAEHLRNSIKTGNYCRYIPDR